MLNLDADQQALKNTIYLGLTEEDIRNRNIEALYKASLNAERLPTLIAGAAGSAVFDMIGAGAKSLFVSRGAFGNADKPWRNAPGKSAPFNPRTLKKLHKTFGNVRKDGDNWDLSQVGPDGMRILETWGVVREAGSAPKGFKKYNDYANWELVKDEDGYLMDKLIKDVADNKQIIENTILKMGDNDEVISEFSKTIKEGDAQLESLLGGESINHSIVHMLDVFTRGTGNAKLDAVSKFISASAVKDARDVVNDKLLYAVGKMGLARLDSIRSIQALSYIGENSTFWGSAIGKAVQNSTKGGVVDMRILGKEVEAELSKLPINPSTELNDSVFSVLRDLRDEGATTPGMTRLVSVIEQYFMKTMLDSYAGGNLLNLQVHDIPVSFFKLDFVSKEAQQFQELMENLGDLSTSIGGRYSVKELESRNIDFLSKLQLSALGTHTGEYTDIIKSQSIIMGIRTFNHVTKTLRKNPEYKRDLFLAKNLAVLIRNAPRTTELNRIVKRVSEVSGWSKDTTEDFEDLVRVASDIEQRLKDAGAPFVKMADTTTFDLKGNLKTSGESDIANEIKMVPTEFSVVRVRHREKGDYTEDELARLNRTKTTYVQDLSGRLWFKFKSDKDQAAKGGHTKFKDIGFMIDDVGDEK